MPTIADVQFYLCAGIRKVAATSNQQFKKEVLPYRVHEGASALPGSRCCLWAILLLTVCVCEVPEFIAKICWAVMSNWNRQVEFNAEFNITCPAPNQTCNVAAAEVPTSCRHFAKALLAAELIWKISVWKALQHYSPSNRKHNQWPPLLKLGFICV